MAVKSLGDQYRAKGPLDRAGQYLQPVTLFPHMTTAPQPLADSCQNASSGQQKGLNGQLHGEDPIHFCVRISVPDPALVCLQVAFGMC
jgi:hypothetical protein